jgi:hypothetical protein
MKPNKHIVSTIDHDKNDTRIITYRNANGKIVEMNFHAVVQIPANFYSALNLLINDLQLALDCIDLLGAMPVPVAKAILRNIEPAQAAIDMAVRRAKALEKEAR